MQERKSIRPGTSPAAWKDGAAQGDATPPDPLSDDEFEGLFRELYGPVYGFFRKWGWSVDEAKDLTQDTCFRIYKSRETFRGSAKIKTWVFQIALNVHRQTIRDKRAQKRAVETEDLSRAEEMAEGAMPVSGPFPRPAEDPQEAVLLKERRRLVADCMAQLPEQMGQCVRLRAQDLTYREIASVMDLSINTVKSHLFQARQKLKECVGDGFEDLGL